MKKKKFSLDLGCYCASLEHKHAYKVKTQKKKNIHAVLSEIVISEFILASVSE